MKRSVYSCVNGFEHHYDSSELSKCVDNILSEMGGLFGVKVHNPTGLDGLISSKSLPEAPFHTVLRVGVGGVHGWCYYVYASLSGSGVLEVYSTSLEHHLSVLNFSADLCKSLSSVFSRPIAASVSENFNSFEQCGAESSLNRLAEALGTKLTFTMESIIATGAIGKHEPFCLGENFCEEVEAEWLFWLENVLAQTPFPGRELDKNFSRLQAVFRSMRQDICKHIPEGRGNKMHTDWLEGSFEHMRDIVEEERREMFHSGREGEALTGSTLTDTGSWVSRLCGYFPLEEFKSEIPAYKYDFYKKAAANEPGLFPVYVEEADIAYEAEKSAWVSWVDSLLLGRPFPHIEVLKNYQRVLHILEELFADFAGDIPDSFPEKAGFIESFDDYTEGLCEAAKEDERMMGDFDAEMDDESTSMADQKSWVAGLWLLVPVESVFCHLPPYKKDFFGRPGFKKIG